MFFKKLSIILLPFAFGAHSFAEEVTIFGSDIKNSYLQIEEESKVQKGKLSLETFKKLSSNLAYDSFNIQEKKLKDKIVYLPSDLGVNAKKTNLSEVLSILSLSLPNQKINEIAGVTVAEKYKDDLQIGVVFKNRKHQQISSRLLNSEQITPWKLPSNSSISFPSFPGGVVIGPDGRVPYQVPGPGDIVIIETPEGGGQTIMQVAGSGEVINVGSGSNSVSDPNIPNYSITNLPECVGNCGPGQCLGHEWNWIMFRNVYTVKYSKHQC